MRKQCRLLARDHPDLPIVINHAGSPVDRAPVALQLWQDGLHRTSLTTQDSAYRCRNIDATGGRI